ISTRSWGPRRHSAAAARGRAAFPSDSVYHEAGARGEPASAAIYAYRSGRLTVGQQDLEGLGGALVEQRVGLRRLLEGYPMGHQRRDIDGAQHLPDGFEAARARP